MTTYYRIQTKNISFGEMQNHRSASGSDEMEDGYNGLCASDSVYGLRQYISSWMAGGDPDTDFEIVIFSGSEVERIYDGVVVNPQKEIMRVAVSDFMENDQYINYEER